MLLDKKYLTGSLVTLKNIEESDLSKFLAIENTAITRLLADDELPTPRHKDKVSAFINNQDEDKISLAVYLNESDELVGSCCMYNYDSFHSHCEIGLTIASDCHGKGIGSETLDLLVSFIFNYLPVNKVKLQVFSFNPGAIHVYEKYGFVLEGTLRQEIFRFGEYHDLLDYSMLRSEFVEKQIKK